MCVTQPHGLTTSRRACACAGPQNDACQSTPYHTVKRYAKDNLVTVRGGGQSGHICGGANRHSFEGRQRGVSRAIMQWMTTGTVQAVVDTDD